jgi:glycosyltransferase involved in cell wall biosynthesis
MNAFAPVSVVVPCYRCLATLERAVSSVLQQTRRPAELILVDDANGDTTWELLQLIQARHRGWVKTVQLPVNVGAASARNAGWNMATQRYVAFLDADDAWHPQKIEIQYSYMQQNLDVVLSGHLCRQLPEGSTDTPLWQLVQGDTEVITWLSLLLRHKFVTPSVMVKREIAFRFAEGARFMEDHRLWLEIVGASLRTVKLNVELAAIYKPAYGSSGLSANLWSMERAELANYRHFHRVGKLPFLQLLLLQCYSLLKFLRRLVIVHLLPEFKLNDRR